MGHRVVCHFHGPVALKLCVHWQNLGASRLGYMLTLNLLTWLQHRGWGVVDITFSSRRELKWMRYISSGTSAAAHAPRLLSPPLQQHLATQSLENCVVHAATCWCCQRSRGAAGCEKSCTNGQQDGQTLSSWPELDMAVSGLKMWELQPQH